MLPIFKQLRQIPCQLWVLGMADGLLNVSAAMIFTISGPFMKDALKSTSIAIGILEGIVEFISWNIRLVSGVFSDYFKNRKFFMVLGYAIVILSRPILALSTIFSTVLVGRAFDRIGKGIHATPREALVADLAPIHIRGACFGLRHSLGIVGSLTGACIVFYMMKIFPSDYRLVFWVSALPAMVALLFLILWVRDTKQPEYKRAKVPLKPKELFALGKEYWRITTLCFLLMLCRSSEVFITLRALELEVPLEFVPFIMVTYNLSESVISYPIGILSDHLGRPFCITVAIICLSLANFLIGTAQTKEIIFLGAFLWGIQRGIGHSIFLSWIADKSPPHLRATAYGAFYFVGGTSLFIANLISGIVINLSGYKALYIGHALLGIFPLMNLVLLVRRAK